MWKKGPIYLYIYLTSVANLRAVLSPAADEHESDMEMKPLHWARDWHLNVTMANIVHMYRWERYRLQLEWSCNTWRLLSFIIGCDSFFLLPSDKCNTMCLPLCPIGSPGVMSTFLICDHLWTPRNDWRVINVLWMFIKPVIKWSWLYAHAVRAFIGTIVQTSPRGGHQSCSCHAPVSLWPQRVARL